MQGPLSRRQTWIALISGTLVVLGLVLIIGLWRSSNVASLSDENQQLRERITHLSSALTRFSADQADVATVIEALEADLARMRRDYQDMANTATETQTRLEAANERLDRLAQLERQNQELVERNAILVEQLEASRESVRQLQQSSVTESKEPTDAAAELF
ncbi:hypothetical protein [Saccharospirillum mangrovi]|uniref:hypothetical protein n=1 Tax=Saccharospirillum mangrovi TaxID=2161747 RepID=UPI000D35044B|nr:hypothetical protein [Saccharospirillum mangrovi]